MFPAPYAVSPAAPQLGTLLHALPLGIAVLDHQGCVIATNAAFRLTVDSSCPVGEPMSENIALPADRPALRRAIADALSGSDLPIELRVRIPTRPDEPLVMTLARAPAGSGTLLMAVRDIREQLRLERQVAQVTKMQAIGQLAGGVAHDFNNILTANLGLVDQLLARHRPGDEDFEDLDQVRLNNARGANLVRQLLAFARQQTLRLQLVDIRAVIAPLAALLERLLGESVHLDLEFGSGVGPIRVDPGQLEQVIVNLAVNARDAMPGGGKLCISTRAIPANAVAALGHGVMPAADFVEIAVRDSGTGIPPALGGKIFEPFFTTKEAGKGTGLGLSTVYGIVKQSGGFVFNAPAPGGGTVFTLYFPRAAGDVATAAPIVAEPDDSAAGRGRELLLVEDDRAVRLVLRRALAGAGFKVTEAVDALAALPIVEDVERVIDIMVTDVMMPGMDGPQLVQRARQVRPGLPVVMMSGYAEPPQRARVGERGTAFLAKPFGGAALIAAVRATLATTPGGPD